MARARADACLSALLAAGLVDPSSKVVSAERVTIPLRPHSHLSDWARRLEGELVEDAPLPPREERPTPRERVAQRVPPEARAHVPDKWELLGDVLVLRVPDAMRPHARAIAAAFAEVLGAKCVVEDVSGVAGELREMSGALLWGDDPVTTHVENGVRYRLDASRIMFASGNKAERIRAASVKARGETVVDMFAGIGYFTLPLAVHARPARIHALEKNPRAFAYLVENVALNEVDDVVEPWLGDNRDVPLEYVADRVLMGYFPGTRTFLPKAFRLLKPEGGVVHYHDTAHATRWKEELVAHVLAAARACGRVVAIEGSRVVKSHSPGVVHAVVEARVRSGAKAESGAPV